MARSRLTASTTSWGGVEVALAFHHVADAAPAQRVEVDLYVGEGAQEKGHVAGARRHGLAVPVMEAGASQDLVVEPAGQGFRLQPARRVGVEPLPGVRYPA